MEKQKHIRYNEGQWFAVPLRSGGYALGIIVRGRYKTKGGLGYFFGPKFPNVPGDQDTWDRKPEEAILIGQFGDLGIIDGSWPLIYSTRPFSREQWPVPKFGMPIHLVQGKGYIREYGYDEIGKCNMIKETVVDINEIRGLPEDGSMGGGFVEIRLTRLLAK